MSFVNAVNNVDTFKNSCLFDLFNEITNNITSVGILFLCAIESKIMLPLYSMLCGFQLHPSAS